MKPKERISKLERERINLSLSARNKQERKIILINKMKFNLKISERMTLSGHSLIKYLILIGLEKLENDFGEINEIFKKKGC
jgi:hypothetical protein